MAAKTTVPHDNGSSEPLLARLRRRRVTREFMDAPVDDAHIRQILEGGRWASSGGNLHPHRFVVVADPRLVELVEKVSPGILGNPRVLIVICSDLDLFQAAGSRLHLDRTRYIDVGTAAMNMLLVAQDLGLGACPVTSFSQRAVAMLLDLPATFVPELMVLLGHPAPAQRPPRSGSPARLTVDDLSFMATPDRGLQRLASRE
jgi:nitroreductase